MKKTIFINLAIDQHWDVQKNIESFFSAKVPGSEFFVRANENLGLYLSQAGDTALGFCKDSEFQDFLSLRASSWGTLLEIASNPTRADAWLEEVQSRGVRVESEHFISASISRLEARLLGESNSRAEKMAVLNRKTLLVEFAKEGLIEIPPTSVIRQSAMREGRVPSFSGPKLLKHVFGSGGSGNFPVNSNLESTFVYLQRRLEGSNSDESWLLQDRIRPEVEGCAFGDTDADGATVVQVEYDTHGLSTRHVFNVSEKLKERVLPAFERIRERLKELHYSGPFGLDFIVAATSQNLYFVDLNVRLTKTHLLMAAIEKMGLSPLSLVALRFRWAQEEIVLFSVWWEFMKKSLGLSKQGESAMGDAVVPFHVAGLKSPGRHKEVSLFVTDSAEFQVRVLDALARFGKTGVAK